MSSASNPLSADRRPVSRGCCLAGVLGLVVLAVGPCLLLWLMSTGELHWARGPFVDDRLWLVREADASGVGYAAARIVASEANGPVCVRTTISFLLWEGENESLTYDEAYAPNAQGEYELTGSCLP